MFKNICQLIFNFSKSSSISEGSITYNGNFVKHFFDFIYTNVFLTLHLVIIFINCMYLSSVWSKYTVKYTYLQRKNREKLQKNQTKNTKR